MWSSGADGHCWDLYLRVGLPFEKCKGTALTRSGVTERPVPEASSRPGSTLFVSLFMFFFTLKFLPYVNIEFPAMLVNTHL